MTELSASVAVIGGTGLNQLPGLEGLGERVFETPFGAASAPLQFGRLQGHTICFLARHGLGHTLAPHRINYRANLWALKAAGVTKVLAVAAVGSMRRDLSPGRIAIPEQIIDYTWSREHTFHDGRDAKLEHVEFAKPYSESLRRGLIETARGLKLEAVEGGIYGCTQGPRLETEAEIARLVRDGCDLVGMTGMPEAALARELKLDYACIAVSVNWAAGWAPEIMEGGIHDQIEQSIRTGMERVQRLLTAVLPQL